MISDILPNVSKPLDDKKTRNTLEKITIWLHNKKILAALGGICCIAIIIAVIALASPKKADDIIDAMATQSSVTHLEEKTQDDLAEEDKYFNESETSEKNDVPVENAEQTTAAEENAADESEAAKSAATVQPVAITEFDMGDIPSNDSFSKSDICKILPDVSPTTVEAVLGSMTRDGSIMRIGSGRSTRYIKNK